MTSLGHSVAFASPRRKKHLSQRLMYVRWKTLHWRHRLPPTQSRVCLHDLLQLFTRGLRLLLPLALEQESTRASHALVLVPHGTEGYAATAVLTLERAYICARIVSVELPRWLCADYSLPVQQ